MPEYFTNDGTPFIIRPAVEDDAAGLIEYSKIIFASTDQVLTTPDEYTITVDQETAWIRNAHQDPNTVVLIAELNKKIVGMLFFLPNKKRKNAHVGEFGVNVHPDFRGRGIGKQLIETLLDWARDNEQIEKVVLSVFATNTSAINLYEKLGFNVEGRHIHAIKQLTGEYVDVIQMYIETK